jgi:flagellar biosynthesis/type III secretory pathway protein FliH
MNEVLNKKKVASLVRLLSSENEGETIACVRALRKTCSLVDLGNLIEESDRSSLAKKDMQYLYDSGYKDGFEKGKEEGYKLGLAESQKTYYRGSQFGDVYDNSLEEQRVIYCSDRKRNLKAQEQDFIDSCVHRVSVMKKSLTPAQAGWLNSIYRRLGGP